MPHLIRTYSMKSRDGSWRDEKVDRSRGRTRAVGSFHVALPTICLCVKATFGMWLETELRHELLNSNHFWLVLLYRTALSEFSVGVILGRGWVRPQVLDEERWGGGWKDESDDVTSLSLVLVPCIFEFLELQTY